LERNLRIRYLLLPKKRRKAPVFRHGEDVKTKEETTAPLKKTRKKVNPAIMINPANIRIPAIDP